MTYFFFCSFNSILDIYRTGVLHLNTDLCALVLQKDLEYWQIDELILGNYQVLINLDRLGLRMPVKYFYFQDLSIVLTTYRTMLRSEVLSWNRNLCQRTKRWAGSKTKRSSKIRRWKFWFSRRWSSKNIPLESNGIPRNVETSTGQYRIQNEKIIDLKFVS